MKKNKKHGDDVHVRGFYRLKIGLPDKDGNVSVIQGDSGWRENTVTNLGKDQYLSQLLANMAGSKQVLYAALGTGTAPGAADTSLNGEIVDASNCRMSVTPSTVNASGTVQFAFTLNSNIITAAKTIQNVGLFNVSTTSAGTIFAGNTYATSALATNQAVNGSYQIRF